MTLASVWDSLSPPHWGDTAAACRLAERVSPHTKGSKAHTSRGGVMVGWELSLEDSAFQLHLKNGQDLPTQLWGVNPREGVPA